MGVFTLRYENSSHPTRWASIHPRRPILFLWWRWWVWDFFGSHCVPNKLSTISQNVPQVPNVFPNMFTLLCPIWFAFNFYSCNLYKQPKGGDYYSIYQFGDCRKLDKIFCAGWIKGAHHKRKKLHWGLWGGSTQLINLSHTLYHYKNSKKEW
jgi:hypothetical protein